MPETARAAAAVMDGLLGLVDGLLVRERLGNLTKLMRRCEYFV